MKRVRHALAATAATAVLASAGAALASVPISAGPCVSFQVMGTDLNLSYNPFSPAPVNRPFLLKVTRLDSSVSAVRFLLTDATPDAGRSRIGPAGPVNYDVVWLSNSGQQVFYPHFQSLNPADTVTTSFGSGPAGSVQTVQMSLHIPPGQPVAASLQTETLAIEYQCEHGSTTGIQETQNDNRVKINLAIPRYFGAYIGAPGLSRGRIDFGTLAGDASDAEKRIAVTAVSTVPYKVQITTDRGSALRRSDHDSDGIPYTMQFDNYDVRDRSELTCSSTRSSLGDTEQLRVKLDANHLDQLHAGAYRDTITLTFTPLDVTRHAQGCLPQP